MDKENGEKKPVAVIILNWNGAELLKKCLPSVIANTNAEIGQVIVADNGSVDESRDVLGEEFPNVETLYLKENYGFAEGYNRSIGYTGYKYTVLLNSDVEPAPGWLEPLYEFMEAHPEAGGCQPKILSYNDRSKFEYAGAAGGYLDRNGYPYCRGRIFDLCETDRGQYDSVAEVDWASGAALMVRTELYESAGGLDPKFFAHMEEIDLCWRIRQAGHPFYCVPSSTVYHIGGGSLPASNPRKTYLNFRNNLLMLHKNLPKAGKRRALVWRQLLDTAAWFKFMITADWKNAGALQTAHHNFHKMRKEIPALYPEKNLLKGRPNILVEYYLRGHKKFSQINSR